MRRYLWALTRGAPHLVTSITRTVHYCAVGTTSSIRQTLLVSSHHNVTVYTWYRQVRNRTHEPRGIYSFYIFYVYYYVL